MQTPKSVLQTIRLLVAVTLATMLTTTRPVLLGEINVWAAIALILIFSVLATYGLEHFLAGILVKNLFFRRHVFGRNYIEGFWWANVPVQGTTCLEVTCIEHTDDGYHIEGWQYTDREKLKVTWSSEIVKFDGSKLAYFYHAIFHERPNAPNVFGFSELTFIRQDFASAPSAFSGYYGDFHTPGETQHTFQAIRMSDDQAAKFPVSPYEVIQRL